MYGSNASKGNVREEWAAERERLAFARDEWEKGCLLQQIGEWRADEGFHGSEWWAGYTAQPAEFERGL
jgi:hypothetical protein